MKNRPRLSETGHTNISSAPVAEYSTQAFDESQICCVVSTTSWIRRRLSSLLFLGENAATSTEQNTSQPSCCRKKLEDSLAKTVLYVVIAFSLAIFPTTILIVIGRLSFVQPLSSDFNPVGNATWSGFLFISTRILFINSAVNCIIYSYRSNEFHATVKKIFSCSY